MVATLAISSLVVMSIAWAMISSETDLAAASIPTLEEHGVGAGGQVLQAFGHNRMCQNGGSGGAVTGDVIGLGGSFFEELCTHILKGIFQFDLFRNGHAIVGDCR